MKIEKIIISIILIMSLIISVVHAQGLIEQGIERVGKGLQLLEEKMKALEDAEKSTMDTLDNDLEDLKRTGLRQDKLMALQKIREEKRTLRKLAKTKSKVLATMYRILRVLPPIEQGRLVRKLRLSNRLLINQLAPLGVDDGFGLFTNGFISPSYIEKRGYETPSSMLSPFTDVVPTQTEMDHTVRNAHETDYFTKDDDAQNDPVEQKRKQLDEIAKHLSEIETKYRNNPEILSKLKEQSSVQYKKTLGEMISNIEKSVKEKGRQAYDQSKRIDIRIDNIENNMEFMTEQKRAQAMAELKMLKSQRDQMQKTRDVYRTGLTRLAKSYAIKSRKLYNDAQQQTKEARQYAKAILENKVPRKNLIIHGTDAVINKLKKKEGVLIDTNLKQRESDMTQRMIPTDTNINLGNLKLKIEAVPNRITPERTPPPAIQPVVNKINYQIMNMKKGPKTIVQTIREIAQAEMKKMEKDDNAVVEQKVKQVEKIIKKRKAPTAQEIERKHLANAVTKTMKRNVKIAKPIIQTRTKINENKKQMEKMKELLNEMTLDRESIEDEIKTALEI